MRRPLLTTTIFALTLTILFSTTPGSRAQQALPSKYTWKSKLQGPQIWKFSGTKTQSNFGKYQLGNVTECHLSLQKLWKQKRILVDHCCLSSFRGPLLPVAQKFVEDTFSLGDWLYWELAQKDSFSWGSGWFTFLAEGENWSKILVFEQEMHANSCNQSHFSPFWMNSWRISPQTQTPPMEAPLTRFQREVDPRDEGQEVRDIEIIFSRA